jgi:mono/diheme cytochrome c family protein
MTPIKTLAALALLALATPAFPTLSWADEPGPGGTKPVIPKNGQETYQMVCQACHMADAKGATGAGTFPALAGNDKLGTAEYPIFMVVNGKGGMPWFYDTMTPQQIAEVVTYVRTHFGNAYKDPVTAAQVKAVIDARGK